MPAARIIITADDFGRSAKVNHAILEWAEAGALTQASLMVNEPQAAEAARKSLPGVTIGLHLTLCDGIASDGRPLPRTPAAAGLRFAFWPGARAWLRREIRAQFERFCAHDLPRVYWDGHTHLHLHPSVMSIALPIAATLGFRRTRLVREPGARQWIPWIFDVLSRRALPHLSRAGVQSTDYTFGLRQSGRMTAHDFTEALRWADRGSVEIYVHPGAEDRLPDPRWVAEIVEEKRAALSGER